MTKFFAKHFDVVGYNLNSARSGKSILKMAKFEAQGIKEKIYTTVSMF